MSKSPYLFRAADHPLVPAGRGLLVREAITPFGIALRCQERAPGPADGHWCETGRNIFLLFRDAFSCALTKGIDAPPLYVGNDFGATDIRPALP